MTSPFEQLKYELAPNVQSVLKIPQWGLLQPAEYSHHHSPSRILAQRWNTSFKTIGAKFEPFFERFLALILAGECDSTELGSLLLEMQVYFQLHDYTSTMNSGRIWELFLQAVTATYSFRPPATENPSFGELKQAYRLLYHLLIVLHFPIPKADISHSSAASFCGIPCILAKLVDGTPYLLTEHGVYLREQYLNLRNYIKSFFVRWFLYRLVRSVVELNYHFADQISPVCAYNARWEEHLGLPPTASKSCTTGSTPRNFIAANGGPIRVPWSRPSGLIYPLKGQLDLISAASLLKGNYSNLEVRFYGNPSDKGYFEACKKSVSDLELEQHVTFAGSTNEPWKVYSNADVMAFASISEAFPYVVVEAMLCGAAIVSTDVGGVREALGECGLLAPRSRRARWPMPSPSCLTIRPSGSDWVAWHGLRRFYGRPVSRLLSNNVQEFGSPLPPAAGGIGPVAGGGSLCGSKRNG